MKIINIQSLNYSKKPRNKEKIQFIIFHYTGMQSKRASIKRLTSKKHKVSCHYLVDQKGKIFQLVKDKYTAWHAGKSKWKNIVNLNENSIGIELVNKGHKIQYENFTSLQINNLIQLCLKLKKKYKIKPCNFLGHSDIAPIRKQDPGENFPWKILSKKGLGKWYNLNSIKNKKKKVKNNRNLFFRNLFKIGYRYFKKNRPSKHDSHIIKSFQRRYSQNMINGKINQKMQEISQFLANNIK